MCKLGIRNDINLTLELWVTSEQIKIPAFFYIMKTALDFPQFLLGMIQKHTIQKWCYFRKYATIIYPMEIIVQTNDIGYVSCGMLVENITKYTVNILFGFQ